MQYTRNVTAFTKFSIGLESPAVGALSMIIDLMVTHDGKIPDDPAYIAAQLKMSVKMWRKVEKDLTSLRKIRKHKERDKVHYVLDPQFAVGTDAVIVRSALKEAILRGPGPVMVVQDPGKAGAAMAQRVKPEGVTPDKALDEAGKKRRDEKVEILRARREAILSTPTQTVKPEGVTPDKEGVTELSIPNPGAQPTGSEADREEINYLQDIEKDAVKFEPRTIPVSAYDILKRAGLNPDAHPRGEMYWMRSDHHIILDQWLAKLSADEITARLARAVQSGKIEPHANSLARYQDALFKGDQA